MTDRIAQLTNRFRNATSGSDPNPSGEPAPTGPQTGPSTGEVDPNSTDSTDGQRQADNPLGPQAQAPAKGQPGKKGVQTRSAAKIGVVPNPTDAESSTASTASKGKGEAQKTTDNPIETVTLLGDRSVGSKGKSSGKSDRSSERSVILTEAMAATKAGEKDKATMLWDVYVALSGVASAEPAKTIPAKHAREESVEVLDQLTGQANAQAENHEVVVVQEGELDFAVNKINLHKDVGFTPYFDKNLKELRAPIPLTIFNKKWQD